MQMCIASQADLAAEEAAATEAALRKRGQNVDDMEASLGRQEVALGEAAAKLEERESALRSGQQALEQQQTQLRAAKLDSKELQVGLLGSLHSTLLPSLCHLNSGMVWARRMYV